MLACYCFHWAWQRLEALFWVSQPSARGERNKKKSLLLTLNMPIYLFFYFIALVIAINPAWSAFFFFSFMLVTFQCQVSTQPARQTENTYSEMLVKILQNSPSILFSRDSQVQKAFVNFLCRAPLRDMCDCGTSHYYFGCMVLTTFFFNSKNWSFQI